MDKIMMKPILAYEELSCWLKLITDAKELGTKNFLYNFEVPSFSILLLI